MKGFLPGLFDRLMAADDTRVGNSPAARLTLEELKDAVARDLEALLNTRAVIDSATLLGFPECARSILTYGLNDFASLSLASSDDRADICECLETAITRHEPRLRAVKASLEVRKDAINQVNFSISAVLVVDMASEPVNFDAVLQQSSLHYTIRKAPRSGSSAEAARG